MYYSDQELEAAAMRATKKLYPQGDGHWNRVEWLRAVLYELEPKDVSDNRGYDNEV